MRLAAHRNRYRAFHAALTDLYAVAPPAQSATLGGSFSARSGFAAASGPSDTPDFSDATFSDAASIVRRAGQFTPEMMRRPEVRRLVSETAGIFREAIDAHIPTEVSPEVTFALQNNAFIFSGFKVYHSLQEVGLSLLDDKGNIKPLSQFQRDVQQINDKYNHNYLRAEYQHAVGSTLMAARWQQIEADGDRYDLQYRTAQDDRVREDHRLLDGTTLPPSDPFWSKYYPPNGWGCRCTAVQVRRGKFPHTDPDLAMQRGDNCTEAAKQQMFRFNPGKELKVFPPKHPYLPKGCNGCDRNLRLAYNPNSEKCRACGIIAQQSIYQLRNDAVRQMKAEQRPAYISNEDRFVYGHLYCGNSDRKNVIQHIERAYIMPVAFDLDNILRSVSNGEIEEIVESHMSEAKRRRRVVKYTKYQFQHEVLINGIREVKTLQLKCEARRIVSHGIVEYPYCIKELSE